MIRVLFIGDVCGKPGREAVQAFLPDLRKKYEIDLVITNVENSAHGRGANLQTVNELMSLGIDYFTAGNHIWRHDDFHELLSGEYPIIRPLNYPDDVPGKGYAEIDLGAKGKFLLASIIGKAFINDRTTSEPWREVNKLLGKLDMSQYAGSLLEIHAEATAEKVSTGFYYDGKFAAVVGTHTHVPTADERILPQGTAYITDIGMVGPMDSVLWVEKEVIFQQNMFPYSPRYEMEEKKPYRFDAVMVDIIGSNIAEKIVRINRIL